MAITNVYFVRHAEPNYENHNDQLRELTAKGMADRALVTEFLSDKQIHAVLSSPYKRSVDTVKEFADKNSLSIELVDDFRERKIDSVWIEDFNAFAAQQWTDFTYKLSDGECLQEVQDRNINALRQVLAKYRGKNIVIGSHGTALSTVINYYDNSFGYSDFQEIKKLMPWIVHFCFEDDTCIKIKKHNLFTETAKH